MVEMILPDGTYVSSIVANLNTFSSNPGTSKGEGEIIYNTTLNKVYVNIGTTGSPNWYDISGGTGGDADTLDGIDSTGFLQTSSPNLPLSYSAGNLGLLWGSSLALSGTDLVVNPANIDHGGFAGLSHDDHTQYLLVNGTRNATGDLTIYKTNPNLILYPADTNSPRVQFKNNSNALKGSVYQNADNMVVLCEDGALNIATAVTTGGNVTLETKGVARLTIGDAVLTATVPLAMGTQKITGLDAPTADADAATKAYVDSASSSDGLYICTSDTRPTGTIGRMIYETDTDKILVCTNLFTRLITGGIYGMIDGYYWDYNDSTWVSYPEIEVGWSDTGQYSSPCAYDDNGTWKIYTGRGTGQFSGYYWNGSSWVNSTPMSVGLPDVGDYNTPCVFWDGSTLKLIAGELLGEFRGFYWASTTWIEDTGIVAGLPDVGGHSIANVFLDDTTLKLITGAENGQFRGFYWSGSAWVEDTGLVSGLPDIGSNSAPCVFDYNGVWALISGDYLGKFYGFTWNGSTWSSDGDLNNALADQAFNSTPTVYLSYIWEEVGSWEGTATSDLDMNGYNIVDGSLGADLDANDYNIVNTDTIQAKSTNSLTFKVSTGKSFIFQKV